MTRPSVGFTHLGAIISLRTAVCHRYKYVFLGRAPDTSAIASAILPGAVVFKGALPRVPLHNPSLCSGFRERPYEALLDAWM